MELFQRVQQAFQAVSQGDGGGGVGQQEGAGNQHQDPAGHKDGPLQAVVGDGQLPETHQHPARIRIEQVQHAGENQNHDQRLHAPDNGFGRDPGDGDGRQQEGKHHPVGHPALGAEQGHDVNHHGNQLGSGVQPVNDGTSGEILAQGNVFKHGPSPPSSCTALPRRPPGCTRWAPPPPAPANAKTPGSPGEC